MPRRLFPDKRSALLACLMLDLVVPGSAQRLAEIHNDQLSIVVRMADRSYELRIPGFERPVLAARVGAEIDHRWIRSSDYPQHRTSESAFTDALGSGHSIAVTFPGLKAKPDLTCVLRVYDQHPFGDAEVRVQNRTAKVVTVQAIRTVEAIGEPRIELGGGQGAERVLSDTLSEDRPALKIYDLAQAPAGMHRGVGSQLIYNQESRRSLFLGALTSQRFLTILRLRVGSASPRGQDRPVALDASGLRLDQPPHSVRLIKIIDSSIAASPPSLNAGVPRTAPSRLTEPKDTHEDRL